MTSQRQTEDDQPVNNSEEEAEGVDTSLSSVSIGERPLCTNSTPSLVMAECACASLIFTSFNDVPSLVCESVYWWMALA